MNKAFTLATVCFLLTGCRESTSPTISEQAIPVRVITIAPEDHGGTVQVAGIVKPRLEADLASQIVAPVAAVTKREGDHFRRGEVLVRFHAPALAADVAQANAAVTSAEKQEAVASDQEKLAVGTLGRYAQLRERHSVTPYELDHIQEQAAAARAQHQGAEAQVAAAKSILAARQANNSDAVIYAPFDGVVTKRMVDPGAMATPGVPLLHVQSTGNCEVEFSAPEDLMSYLRVGTEVPIALDRHRPLHATIAAISPAGDAGSHSSVVKAGVPASAPWSTGMVVEVLLPSGNDAASISVPSRAVVQQGGLDAVLIATPDSHAQVRYVTLGWAAGNQTQILSGLQPGDRVLAQGDLGLAGRKIEVRP